MMKTLEKLFGEGCSGAFHVGGRNVAFLLMLALGLFAPQGAKGYYGLGMDRILLLNNDTKSDCPVTFQGYAETNVVNAVGVTNAYWWVRSTETSDYESLLPGTNHVFHAHDGLGGNAGTAAFTGRRRCCAGPRKAETQRRQRPHSVFLHPGKSKRRLAYT